VTSHKHFKQLVRARMEKTGESYSTARRHVIARAPATAEATRHVHLPGNVPAAAALRVLLANAGIRAPHTSQPFSEAMVFGIAGGIGAGMFSFYYEKADFSSFYVAARHLWQDDLEYLKRAAARFGASVSVRESGGSKQADRDLRDILKATTAAIAWVDMGHLPHRALPHEWSGAGYHVITVYDLDGDAAIIGDLADNTIRIPLDDLAAARARIKKQKNRLLTVESPARGFDLRAAVMDGLKACHDGMLHQRMRNLALDSLAVWAQRLHGDNGKESWDRVFRHGRPLWYGLRSITEFIEYYGTGGGLARPIFAEFLLEAAEALNDPRLRALSERYARIGIAWTRLAEAALPDEIPELAETRHILARKAELLHMGSASIDDIRAAWQSLEDVGNRVAQAFSPSPSDTAALRADLQKRVFALHAEEVDALAELAAATQQMQ
jgi:hypothetical protein